MKIRCVALLLCLLAIPASSLYGQLQSPADFLGYEIGERWTPHHRVMQYVKHVAEESELVKVESYGTTYEHRELVYLIVTSEENHHDLEEIRTNNLKLTGLMEGEPTEKQRGIVWMSYNIHGNETSSSEAAMLTLYELVRPERPDLKRWLDNTVLIMDPMVNPDGRERYINWYNQMAGVKPDPSPAAREHHEPWPGGRSNHYLFDLNRDWAWQVQKESRQRYDVYRQWFPHIHVDFHEQGYNTPYYFAPGAEPVHKAITDWQREFQGMIGNNHASYFDDESWLYFTKERFDLFYPSYGDTWPTFHGAVGMTYEMPGHSMAGLAVERAAGDTLTLKQRALQHFTTGLSTVEVASLNSTRMISEFENYFRKAQDHTGGHYKTFVISSDNKPDHIADLLEDLDRKQIKYTKSGRTATAEGYNYSTGSTERVTISGEDILIPAEQPQGYLARVLFEPDPELSDSLTYDITAWEAHYRFGLSGYALENSLPSGDPVEAADYRSYGIEGPEKPYAWIVDWTSMHDARFLAQILQEGVMARVSGLPFELDGRSYGSGSLLLLRSDNLGLGDSFDRTVKEAARKHQRKLYGSSTGMVSGGSDFGSDTHRLVRKRDVALLMGSGTSSLSAGEIWHFLDQQLGYPATLIHAEQINSIDLSDYQVLILPSGSYSQVLDSSAIEKIGAWTGSGGTLIVSGQANNLLAGRNGFQLQRKVKPDTEAEPSVEDQLLPYAERSRRSATGRTPGSIFRVHVDHTHPLGFGYTDEYFTIKTGSDLFSYLDSGWNVGSLQPNAHRSGFAGSEAKKMLEHTLSFGVQPYGSGQVVYFIDNPLFRGFWENGKLLMANAIFFLPR